MEPLYSDLYKLYSRCFPQYPVSQETFWQRLCPEKARVFAEYGQGLLIGCALVHKASIPLLCVDREYRQQGVGARLLASAQGYILGTGARQITLGCGEHYLLQGVPEDPPAPVRFFQRHGYTAPWTSVNMELDLKSFSLKTAAIPPAPENVAFRMARVTDADALLAAVEDAQASWVPIFASCQDPVLLAVAREQIMGFQILSPSGGHFLRSGHIVAEGPGLYAGRAAVYLVRKLVRQAGVSYRFPPVDGGKISINPKKLAKPGASPVFYFDKISPIAILKLPPNGLDFFTKNICHFSFLE